MIALITAKPEIYSSRRFLSVFKDSIEVIHPETELSFIQFDLYSYVIPRYSIHYLNEGNRLLKDFENYSVPTLTSSRQILNYSDKWNAYLSCLKNNIRMVPTFETPYECISCTGCCEIIVKKRKGSKGEGILRIPSPEVDKFTALFMKDHIFQPFYSELQGSDIRILFLDSEVLGCIRRTSATSEEFRSNYSLGASIEKYEPSFEVNDLIKYIKASFPKGFYGIDIIITNNGPIILEINTCPGFEAFERIFGLVVVEEIERIAEREIRKK